MKDFFKTSDDWGDDSGFLQFNTKVKSKSKTKDKKGNDPEREQEKFITNSLKKKNKKNKLENETAVPSIPNSKVEIAVTKKKKNKKLNQEYEFDGICKFTPLLRKNNFSNEDFETSKEGINNAEAELEENSSTSKKKKSKKRKNNNFENDDNNKKVKYEQKNVSNDKIEDNFDKNLKNEIFANKLRENLLGGRFRFLNEQLYTIPGSEAREIFEQDKDAFKAYHQGYRQQVEKWPFNPLDRIIKRVRRLPKHMNIADFGCGEAKLAESIPHKCFSIDLVSSKPGVIACDMANTPLKPESVDVVVFCLSLMGVNLKDFIFEANRVLKPDGIVYVVEIGSRFEKLKDFKIMWERLGFELLRQDVDKKNYFYFFDFKKLEKVEKNLLNVVDCKLKPCIYKKR